MKARARSLLLAGTAVRLTVGAGYLLAPSRMAAARLAPSTDDRPDARLFVRGFGGHQLVLGALTLAASRDRRATDRVLVANLLIDTLDVASTILEVRARGRSDRALARGIAISGAAMAWAVALRSLGR